MDVSNEDSNRPDLRADFLLQRYFEKIIGDEECIELLDLWQRHPELKRNALKNYEIDHILQFWSKLEDMRTRPVTYMPIPIPDYFSRRFSCGEKTMEDEPEFPGSLLSRDMIQELTLLQDIGFSIDLRSEPSSENVKRGEKSRTSPRPLKSGAQAFRLGYSHFFLFLFLICLAAFSIYHEFFTGPDSPVKSDGPVAVIAETFDVDWGKENDRFKQGARIEMDRIRFDAGVVKVDFKNGTELIVKGPADVVINEALRVTCQNGLLNAFVPSTARGFEVVTPFNGIVDLGTEFAVAVRNDRTDIHILSGLVDITRDKANRISLPEGKALRTLQNGIVEEIVVDRGICPDREEVRELAELEKSKSAQRRMEYHKRFLNDPALLVLYDGHSFRVRSKDVLDVVEPVPDFFNRKIHRIGTPADHVDLSVNRLCRSATLVLFVRVASLEKDAQLWLGKDFSSKAGALDWRLEKGGTVRLSVRQKDEGQVDEFVFRNAFRQRDLGTWTMLTAVFDATSKHVELYTDDRLQERHAWRNPIPIKIGPASIGNGNARNRSGKGADYLDSELDELIIYDRRLHADEIVDLYDCLR